MLAIPTQTSQNVFYALVFVSGAKGLHCSCGDMQFSAFKHLINFEFAKTLQFG